MVNLLICTHHALGALVGLLQLPELLLQHVDLVISVLLVVVRIVFLTAPLISLTLLNLDIFLGAGVQWLPLDLVQVGFHFEFGGLFAALRLFLRVSCFFLVTMTRQHKAIFELILARPFVNS